MVVLAGKGQRLEPETLGRLWLGHQHRHDDHHACAFWLSPVPAQPEQDHIVGAQRDCPGGLQEASRRHGAGGTLSRCPWSLSHCPHQWEMDPSSHPKQQFHPEGGSMLGELGEQLLFRTLVGTGERLAGWCDESQRRWLGSLPSTL